MLWKPRVKGPSNHNMGELFIYDMASCLLYLTRPPSTRRWRLLITLGITHPLTVKLKEDRQGGKSTLLWPNGRQTGQLSSSITYSLHMSKIAPHKFVEINCKHVSVYAVSTRLTQKICWVIWHLATETIISKRRVSLLGVSFQVVWLVLSTQSQPSC